MTEMYIATRRNRRGDARYYWYKSVRRGKTVTGEYVRPASDLEAEEHFRERAEKGALHNKRNKSQKTNVQIARETTQVRTVKIDGTSKKKSHHIWFLNTGYWPDFKNKREVIHHIDGDNQNNDFSNLQLMTNAEHASHHGLIRVGKVTEDRETKCATKTELVNLGSVNSARRGE